MRWLRVNAGKTVTWCQVSKGQVKDTGVHPCSVAFAEKELVAILSLPFYLCIECLTLSGGFIKDVVSSQESWRVMLISKKCLVTNSVLSVVIEPNVKLQVLPKFCYSGDTFLFYFIANPRNRLAIRLHAISTHYIPWRAQLFKWHLGKWIPRQIQWSPWVGTR